MVAEEKKNLPKFREYITHNGTSVLAGKDAKQNEELIAEYIGKPNVIMHTAKPGSPFCVIIDKIKKGDRKQAALLCAKRSQDWRDNKGDITVNMFTGKDVYKRKDMKIGTFGVRNKKDIRLKKKEVEIFE